MEQNDVAPITDGTTTPRHGSGNPVMSDSVPMPQSCAPRPSPDCKRVLNHHSDLYLRLSCIARLHATRWSLFVLTSSRYSPSRPCSAVTMPNLKQFHRISRGLSIRHSNFTHSATADVSPTFCAGCCLTCFHKSELDVFLPIRHQERRSWSISPVCVYPGSLCTRRLSPLGDDHAHFSISLWQRLSTGCPRPRSVRYPIVTTTHIRFDNNEYPSDVSFRV